MLTHPLSNYLQLQLIDQSSYSKAAIPKLEINYHYYNTPLGTILVASTVVGVCYLGFAEANDNTGTPTVLAKLFANAIFAYKTAVVHSHALAIFSAITAPTTTVNSAQLSDRPPLILHVRATDFQLKVWGALLHIPEGQVNTYQNIAQAIDNPKGVRAVGTAIGSNPVSVLIPCHRVIRSDGGIGGYLWGVALKAKLLAIEQAI